MALRGAEQLLSAARNVSVICEITPDRLTSLGGSPQGVIEFMSRRGFAPYVIDNEYSPEAYLRRRHELRLRPLTVAPDGACDLLFVRELPPAVREFVSAAGVA
jgi:hypothetical protein